VIVPAWFDAFTDAIEADEQEYLTCTTCGHGTLPPRQMCPTCGSTDLTRKPLSRRGEIVSFTTISITIPKFHGETPYTVALVELDEEITLTGQLRDVTPEELAIGDEVVLGTEPHDEGTDIITFRPVER
jgi:uncharacterized OB-fold protein